MAADISQAEVRRVDAEHVALTGVTGHARPDQLKVTVCHEGGWLAEGESQLATLRAEAAGGDVERLTRAAHSMKSGAINVGALRLGELCRALEEDGRAGAVGDETTRVALIGEAFDDARRELLAERAARTGGGSPA